MSQQGSHQQWKDALSAPERERVDRAFAEDPDLEADLQAMVEGVPLKSRGLFLHLFVGHLAKVDRWQDAILLTIADMREDAPR